ncbi:hypothetical protein YC2023_036656 [Brassica napus]
MERERVGGPKGERVADFSLRMRSILKPKASQIMFQIRRTAIQLAIEPEVRDRPETIRSPNSSQPRRLQPAIDLIRDPIGGSKRPIISARSFIHSQVAYIIGSLVENWADYSLFNGVTNWLNGLSNWCPVLLGDYTKIAAEDVQAAPTRAARQSRF